MAGSIYLVDVPPALAARLRGHAALAQEVLITVQAGDALGDLEADPQQVAAVVIGPGHPEPVQLAQRIARLDGDVEVLILSTATTGDALRRALRFALHVGPQVQTADDADESRLALLLREAGERTEARRHHRHTLRRLTRAPESPAGALVQPEAYVSSLLDHAPLGVVVTDAQGTVQAWNARAGELLGVGESDALGRPFVDLLPSDEVREMIAGARPPRESTVRVQRRRGEEMQWIQVTAAPLPAPSGRAVMLLLQDITQSTLATDLLDRALKETELLNAIASAASGQADVERILSPALDHLQGVIPFTGGSIALVEDDELVIQAASGASAPPLKGRRLPRGAGRSWQVIETGEPVLAADVRDEGDIPPAGIGSYLAVPLIWAGRAFGVLEVDSAVRSAFEPSDVDLLRRVAAVLSGPVWLARRFDVEVKALAALEEARRRLALVAEASRVLASSLDYETTLTNVARLLVPAVADWLLVDVIGPEGTLQSVALAHADPRREELARELRRRYPPDPGRGHPIFTVVQTGESIIKEGVTDDDLRARAVDEEHYALLQGVGIRSHMVVPLTARGRVLGVLSFVCGPSGRRFAREDLALAEEIGRRAARAIEAAQLYAAEQHARSEAEEAVRRVNAVNSLIALAASAMDLGAVFDEFGEILRTLVPFVRVTVSMYVPETDSLTVPYFKGPPLSAPRERLEGPKAGSARGWVLDHGRAYIRTDTHETQEFSEDALLGASGLRSYVIVPMRVGRHTIGTLNFGHDRPGAYTEAHARVAQPIADQLALTISRFELFEQVQRRAGELSETLQRALLPAGLPEPPFTSIGALYLPADPQAGVGGDWYDALQLPDGTLLLSMGDVAGHGVPAAAAMGQVRHIVRAYALEGRSPTEILSTVNRFLCRLPEGPQLSMWIATVDPYSGAFAYGGGGHPPVLLIHPDGTTAALPCTGPPVGLILTSTHPQGRLTLAPGSRIVAYTDGLLEATRDIAESERRFHDAAVAARGIGPIQAAEMVANHVLGGHAHEDDIAILVFDLLPHDAPLAFGVPATPDALHGVRRAIRAYAIRAGIPRERVEEVVFAVGEAALNSVEHAYRGGAGVLRVRARRGDDRFTVTVRDDGAWRDPVERGRGRGMRIMQQFTDDVQVGTGPDGTVVTLQWNVPRAAAG